MAYLFGVDYYPEHWPRERWRKDAEMMREMGISIVRMAEFSWAKWEPREGEFHFEDLDEVIEILAEQGIDCILGTPSAAPPAWIIRKNPEIQPIDQNGHRRAFGGRHHDCQSNPVYRAHIRRFVTAFAEHFGKNPHVVGWQIDNELGNSHGDLCFCPHCEARFRAWLAEKYGTIAELNRRWGTAFWSQDYASFEEIESPKLTVTGHNPSQQLDWMRFCSDLILEFHQFQADILRAAAPEKFITQNMMGFSDKFDYHKLGEQLDFASHDQYPGGHFRPVQGVFNGDRMAAEVDYIRSTMGKPCWIMEQQSGITGWEILGRAPKPGQLGLWATQCIAHGADTVVFFRWRTCTVGTEQYWHGILPHNGVPGRYYREIRAFMEQNRELLADLQGAMPGKAAAILFSYDQLYAMKIQPHHPELTYIDHLASYYDALYRRNIPVDFVFEEQDFSAYPVLIAPLQFLMTPALAKKLHDYAAGGGTLVLDFRSGVKDADNIAYSEGALPCLVDDLCGITVTEYDCLRDCMGRVNWDGVSYDCRWWSDLMELTTAEAIASYDWEFYKGTPAITRNRFGRGTVYYVGVGMTAPLADRFVDELVRQDGLRPLMDTPEGVEVAHREKDGLRWYFVLNHTGERQAPAIPAAWQQVYGEADRTLPPYSAAVYQESIE
ncbi:MAG: beta-galactosidase [Ruminococcaceae bacterium]|nr:beta-galactosidase [Oscillospiraceae bacterium]